MPGFIDTHHHQFETALRSFLADGVLINDGSGSPSGSTTYFGFILNKFAPVYRPQDVYINERFDALSQLDDGVTIVHDVSQIHHTPQHSDAAIQALAPLSLRLFRGRGKQSFELRLSAIVAGKVRKWKGQLLDLNRLRQQLEASRDYIFSAAGIMIAFRTILPVCRTPNCGRAPDPRGGCG
jgi:cytosine/adenosine deaminase-related metal-dependent hydrolase